MFDHADAGDAVKLPFDVAIVDQLELDLVGHAQFRGAFLRKGNLVGREADPQHFAAVVPVQIKREPAPAATDIEHLAVARLARFKPQLACNQRLLVELRVFERVGWIAKAGHRVLTVFVEEQLVELAGQIVVVLYILAGAAAHVELVELSA